ncbi:MAG: MFS transporter [Arachnia sp.]
MQSAHGRKAWLVWGAGLFVYAITLMHRASLGMAGLEAAAHFGTTPGIVSTFVVLQLSTYALAQVPAGALLDRYGSRVMLVSGSVAVGLGQVMLGLVDDLPLAFAARIFFGLGDACIFNSVIRLLPSWFEPRTVPILSQVTGMAGALGQILSVVLVLPLIVHLGWTTGLLSAAALSLAAAVVAFQVRDTPPGVPRAVVVDRFRDMPRRMLEVSRHPATQLGFWVHFTSGFSFTAFLFMWGMPYLLVGQGLTRPQAQGLLTVFSVAAMLVGPIVGALTARHPLRRSNLALLLIGATAAVWMLVLAWPGRAPWLLLLLLVLVLAAGGPGTAIGFDFPRTSLPGERLGAATGIVIAGGFVGGTLLILLMGIYLDVAAAGQAYTAQHLREAWLLQAPFFVVGLTGMFISRRRLRRLMAERGVVVPSWREVARRLRHVRQVRDERAD